MSQRRGTLADNTIMLLLCSVLMCNTQYYLNDDISLFNGCYVNLTVQYTTFLYVFLSVTDKKQVSVLMGTIGAALLECAPAYGI